VGSIRRGRFVGERLVESRKGRDEQQGWGRFVKGRYEKYVLDGGAGEKLKSRQRRKHNACSTRQTLGEGESLASRIHELKRRIKKAWVPKEV